MREVPVGCGVVYTLPLGLPRQDGSWRLMDAVHVQTALVLCGVQTASAGWVGHCRHSHADLVTAWRQWFSNLPKGGDKRGRSSVRLVGRRQRWAAGSPHGGLGPLK